MTETKSRTLLELGAEEAALWAALDDAGGEVTDENEAILDAYIVGLKEQQGEKLDRYCVLIRRLESEAAAAQAEADLYKKAATVRKNTVANLKERMVEFFLVTGQTKVVTPTGRTVAVQANGGSTPVEIDAAYDINEISEEFAPTVITRDIDRNAVRRALESGRELPFARLGDRGHQLRIR